MPPYLCSPFPHPYCDLLCLGQPMCSPPPAPHSPSSNRTPYLPEPATGAQASGRGAGCPAWGHSTQGSDDVAGPAPKEVSWHLEV